jgi:radical SAM superfamily enzyme YgiQ (UPF0313 family)
VVLLLSTYDLGRQPFGLASAAAALQAAGLEVTCRDLAREQLDLDMVRRAATIAVFVPMHTATRLALPVLDKIKAVNPEARLIAYGLYAPLNGDLLRERGVSAVIGGEFEDALVEAARGGSAPASTMAGDPVPRVSFRVPDRTGLLPLARYAALQTVDGPIVAGHTEASRGCKHRCRHCPIVPVYDGRFRIVPIDVVMADVAGQVAAGARHITFGDPDFFNGIGHAAAILERFAAAFPGITYDVTIKIEHLLRHADRLPLLRATGCAFVTSAVESVEDEVLAALEKGHTRADFERVVESFRDAGLVLVPTFVAFTPWTTLDGYCDLLETIDRLDLVDHVAPIQLAIRLLVTHGSRLLELPAIQSVRQPFNPRSLTYPWAHPDPRVDALQQRIDAEVGARPAAERRAIFDRIWTLAHEAAGRPGDCRRARPVGDGIAVPYLNEPWYCCAEPTSEQVRLV